MTHEWTDGPCGICPVQGNFTLSDGRIGYYRSRGGHTTVDLWPAGTPWPTNGALPAGGDEHDLAAFVDPSEGDEEWDDSTADKIVRRWLAAGAP